MNFFPRQWNFWIRNKIISTCLPLTLPSEQLTNTVQLTYSRSVGSFSYVAYGEGWAGVRREEPWVEHGDVWHLSWLHVEQSTSLAAEKGAGSLAICFHGRSPEFCSWDRTENSCPNLVVYISSQEPLSMPYLHLQPGLAISVESKDFCPLRTRE